ncbi:adenine nucleotide alpha hydrolase family protein [Aureimonas ureilytica]|uniref:phosphoadenosine phosphosulfate reductase family protein n=1 Tax=Aureimonas ureilytica TaxID=401562 RepID=UPI00035FCE34|nr:phosphoadenosine phosphosulfate reductase family protein [Aureimonas ureilytica]
MKERRLLISFSGGETSAMMTKLIHERWAERYDRIVTVFANTGQENEETLRFVQQCDDAFGWGVVWLEALVDPEAGKGTKHRIVSFATADRAGGVFEDMIAKFGIPGPGFFHCTRELKERPITSYVRSIGWEAGSYDTAIGIRADEIDRVNRDHRAKRFVYPMADWRLRKIDVNEFWASQPPLSRLELNPSPFRLNLKGYQGNCWWCWKKSLRKHLTIMQETPEAFDFPERMEAKYSMAGSNPRNEPKRFFRERRTVADLRHLAATTQFEPASDDAREYQTDLFSPLALDLGGDCDEGCEVNFGEAA